MAGFNSATNHNYCIVSLTHQSRKDEDICIQDTVIDMHLCYTAAVYVFNIKLTSSIAT